MIEYTTAAAKLEFHKVLQRIEFYASSELGKAAAQAITPSSDFSLVSTEHDRVTELKRLLESDSAFPIDGIKDIRRLLHHASVENSTLAPPELLAIASTLQASRAIRQFIEKRRESYPSLEKLTSRLFADKVLEFNILQAIDENGTVRDSASKELKMIRSDISAMYTALRKQLDRIVREVAEQGYAQDEIVTTRDGRLVIPVKTEQKNRVPGFIHSSSASGLTVFIEPAQTLSMNNEIRELHFREQREIERILRSLTSLVGERHLELMQNCSLLELIDLTYAKARYSIDIKGNTPHLKESGSIKILRGRHPILLMRHAVEFIVPLDLELGSRFSTILISGPNAGGKSVTLKTVGILSLMVQSGIHIPASPDSEFPMFRRIYTDIGDDQSIENDLSTFSSHIVRMGALLSEVDEHSLVLIDEVGGATDPNEGGALAAAFLLHLSKSGALTIATTHQSSLKAFVHETPGMENGAMEFDQISLLPTYRFRPGVPGSSYAFEIARRLGLSEELLELAALYVGDQKSRMEKLVLDLETRSQITEQRLESIEAERLKYKELNQSLEIKLKALNTEVKDIRSKAIADAKAIVDQANKLIEKSVKEIREQQAEKSSIQRAKSAVTKLAADITAIKDASEEIGEGTLEEHQEPLVKGSIVRLKSGSQIGEVCSDGDQDENVLVAFNSIRMRVKRSDVEIISRSAAREQLRATILIKEAMHELDLRGMYGDEAVLAVDKFLDDATISGLSRVDIIHGIGMGVLRKRVSEFLSGDSRVLSHRLGERGEGGSGITIVELKS
ncbi:MAG: endonuclease MutS2 [Ignavibacteriales bacterium]|nr:endonuclease MutS2 [Ignavibacteriales bacterium]